MYGWKPYLPVALYFVTKKTDMNAATSTKFVQLHERLKGLTKQPNMSSKRKIRDISKTMITKSDAPQLGVGDKVPPKRTASKGKHKIQDQGRYCISC